MQTIIIDDSAKEILREELSSGKTYIKTLNEENIAGYAKAQVSQADTIIPENIKENETILGVTGTYGGGGDFTLTFDSELKDKEIEVDGSSLSADGSVEIKEISNPNFFIAAEPVYEDSGYYLFYGKYNRVNYDGVLIKTDWIEKDRQIILTPDKNEQWEKSKFGSDARLELCKEEVTQVLYKKDPESDINFNLVNSDEKIVNPNTDIISGPEYPNNSYTVKLPGSADKFKVYVNGNFMGAVINGNEVSFNLLNRYCHNGEAVVKVKKIIFVDSILLTVHNKTSVVTSLSYLDDGNYINLGSTWNRQPITLEIPTNTEVKVGGMNFQAFYTGTYQGVEYNNKSLYVVGSNIYSPAGPEEWIFHKDDEGTLTT